MLLGLRFSQQKLPVKMSLFEAAATGDYGKIKILLSEVGQSVNAKDSDGRTALMKACISRQKACIELLLESGADVEATDSKGYNALALVAGIGCEECLSLLLHKGISTNITNNDGDTALMITLQNGHRSCAKELLNAMDEASLHFKNKNGFNAVILAAKEGFADILQALLSKNGDLDAHDDEEGNTALLWTVMHNHPDCLMLLLDAGADMNVRNGDSETALTLGAIEGHTECLKILIDRGLDVNETNGCLNTPLMYSAFTSKLDCVKLLIKNGANVNAVSNTKETALKMSTCEKIVRELYLAGADAEIAEIRGYTPLIYSAREGYTDLLKLHLSMEDKNKKTDANHRKALIDAVECVRPSCLPILLEDGVFEWHWFSHLQNNWSCNLLMKAVVNSSSIPMGRIFIDSGACYTPLQHAFLCDNLDMVKYLLANIYMTGYDFKMLPYDEVFFKKILDDTNASRETKHFFLSFKRTLWPLSSLCFLTISSSIGHHKNRKKHIEMLPLPTHFKTKLKFEDHISKLCHNDWKHIGLQPPLTQPVEPIDLICVCKPVWPPLHMLVSCKNEYCCAGDGLKIQYP